MSVTEYESLSEIASHNGPDSHGNLATELAEGRYVDGKSREAREVTSNQRKQLNNNKNIFCNYGLYRLD